MNKFDLIIIFVISSLLIPIISGLFRLSRLKTEMAILLGLFIFMFVEEIYMECVYHIYHTVPYWVQHIYGPIEYIIIIFVFSRWIDNSIIKRVLWISVPINIALAIISVFTFESLKDTNSSVALIFCVIYLFISVYVVFTIFTKDRGEIMSNYKFWISSGLLIDSSGSLLYFAFYDFLVTYYVWLFHNICNVIAHLFYAKGFLSLPKK
jgi:hypothetical protein